MHLLQIFSRRLHWLPRAQNLHCSSGTRDLNYFPSMLDGCQKTQITPSPAAKSSRFQHTTPTMHLTVVSTKFCGRLKVCLYKNLKHSKIEFCIEFSIKINNMKNIVLTVLVFMSNSINNLFLNVVDPMYCIQYLWGSHCIKSMNGLCMIVLYSMGEGYHSTYRN